ncbi:MAG: NlpC/P60 family protein [Acidimicrobiales bacterium]
MTVVTVCSCTVVLLPRPVGADTIASAQAKAAAIEATLSAAQNRMSALSQQYDEARSQLSQIDTNIATTKSAIAANQQQVAKDKTTLEKAAVSNYVTDGSAASANPIFSDNEKTIGATTEYNQIASGDLNQAVANLHTAETKLAAKQAQLTAQQGQAQSEVSAEQAAVAQNEQVEQEQSAALAQENGEIATLVQQQQQAEAAQAAQAAQAKVAAAQQAAAQAPAATTIGSAAPVDATAAPPPTAAGGEGAVQAAESQIGVPYVWGGESPRGTPGDPSGGFDCSGLTAWSWGQVGVPLPHYSGAQMGDSTPVPVSDLEPGDLLFYGPGGSEHVAMYVGGGTMIEAPYTGASVWLTGLRLGDGFVGAGRP